MIGSESQAELAVADRCIDWVDCLGNIVLGDWFEDENRSAEKWGSMYLCFDYIVSDRK